MAARRCNHCHIYWPVGQSFEQCPECGARTEIRNQEQAEMTYSEATARVRQAKFEAFYAGWEQARIERGEPTPEEIGAREAREQLAQLRELEALAGAEA